MNTKAKKRKFKPSSVRSVLRGPWSYLLFLSATALALPLFVVIYVYYFRPSLLQESISAAGLSILALALARASIVRALLEKYGARQIFQATYRFRVILALTLLIVLICQMVWIVNKIEALRDRYEYVSIIKKSLSADRNDELISGLARAFFLQPSRPEVQVMFTRLSRSLLFARESSYFRAYQRNFLSELKKIRNADSSDDFEVRIGAEHKGRLDHDPLIFYWYTILESGADFLSNSSAPGASTVSAVEKYFALKSSGKTSFLQTHRAIHVFKIDSTIAERGLLDMPHYKSFQPFEEIEKIKDNIAGLPEGELAELISSHHYQEFLDQVLYRHVERALAKLREYGPFQNNEPSWEANHKAEIDRAIEIFAEILRLRQYFGSQGELFWMRQPTKLNAFHFFATLEQLGVQSDSSLYKKALIEGDLAMRLGRLLDQPTFDSFMKEREWYKGSPLTFELDNAEFSRAILNMLDEGWS